jgi:hypothetical protein
MMLDKQGDGESRTASSGNVWVVPSGRTRFNPAGERDDETGTRTMVAPLTDLPSGEVVEEDESCEQFYTSA